MNKDQYLNNDLSIVITTYNRKSELIRCLNSIYQQTTSFNLELIVVDDASSKSYENEIKELFPGIKFISQTENQGPGVARNKGIAVSTNNFVIIMDDDDVFVEGAFDIVKRIIDEEKIQHYPKVSFLISNAKVNFDEKFYIYSFDNLLKGEISGDTCQVINKKLWEKEGYMFPKSRIGAETLLWYRIAIDYGYPVVNEVIVDLMEDAIDRLTDYNKQIEKADLFAQYQIDIIDNFGSEIIKTNNIPFLITKYKGAIVYSLLSGQKEQAKQLIKELKKIDFKNSLILRILALFNEKVISTIFLKYRELSKKK